MYIFVISICMNFISGYYLLPKGHDHIVDVGHNVLPQIPFLSSDCCLYVTMFLGAINRYIFTRRYFNILAFLYFARSATILLTVLPNPLKEPCTCRMMGYCNDFIYSGHTVVHIVTSYFIGGWVWPMWPILCSLVTIASRAHYTVDVWLPWVLFCALTITI